MLIIEGILLVGTIFAGIPMLAWLAAINSIAVIVLAGGVVISYFKLVSGDWEQLVDTTVVEVEEVSIPMADGWNAFARVLRPRGEELGTRPAVIVHHGLNGNGKKMLGFAVPLAMAGHVVLLPDARAHGESVKANRKARKDDWNIDERSGIINDATRFVDFCCSLEGVDANRVAMLGHSMGGLVCLTAGLADPRVKLVIPVSPLHSFTGFLEARRAKRPLSEEWFMKHALRFLVDFKKLRLQEETVSSKHAIAKAGHALASEKIRLVHCKDDELVLFEDNAEPIARDAGILPQHALFLEKGGHSLRGQETIITTKILSWLSASL